jgi:large subunit ribosomal protein L10
MPITRTKKQEVLGKLVEVAKSPASVFVKFHELPMTETTQLRQALRKNGVRFLVAKKTLIRKAFNEAGIDGEIPELEGELAIAYSDDTLAPAREVYAFQKKLEGKLAIQGGVFEKAFKGKEDMITIALIPDQKTLRGMFVNLINSPIQGFVLALNAIAEKKQA